MKGIDKVIRAYAREPWAITPEMLAALAAVFGRKLRGEALTVATLHAELGLAALRDRGEAPSPPRLAVIPIQGVIGLRESSMGDSVDSIGARLDMALNSKDVDGILFAVDSPGGTVTGIPELAERIMAGSQQKPMLAFTDGLMASAAYWLGAAAGDVMASKSAEVGSIGVYSVHEDWSKNFEQEGVAVTMVSAGKYKLEGNPWEPLSAEAKTEMQTRVDEAYDWFTKAVALARADTPANVKKGYGEGRVLGAEQAKAANLIDRVGTVDDAIARLSMRAQPRGRRADVLRKQADIDGARQRVM